MQNSFMSISRPWLSKYEEFRQLNQRLLSMEVATPVAVGNTARVPYPGFRKYRKRMLARNAAVAIAYFVTAAYIAMLFYIV